MTEALQRTSDWYEQRRGNLTASRLVDALKKLKNGKWSTDRETYMVEIVAERLTKQVANHFTSKAMDWGNRTEAEAVAAYEFFRGVDTQECGYHPHPTILQFGATPDRKVGDNGGLEIKCLITRNHLQVLRAGEMPEEYLWQVQGELACTGWDWIDWCSFDPRLPPEMQLFVQRVPRVPDEIARLEAGAVDFLRETEEMIADLWKAVGR